MNHGRKYEQLDIVQFGVNLVRTGDLDPVYVALREMRQNRAMEGDQLSRWLVAYWAYYSCGVACWMSERTGDDFWEAMGVAARNDESAPHGGRWERGHERRHFRAAIALNALQDWIHKYDWPEDMVDYIVGPDTTSTYKDITRRVLKHNGCGPWIAWKVADMVNALGLGHVDFRSASLSMYRDPVKAAHMLYQENFPAEVCGDSKITDERAIEWALEYLDSRLGDLRTPHAPHRTLQLEEYETILCKWKSHRNGCYPPLNDLRDIEGGVTSWLPYSTTAEQFLKYLPK